MRIHGPTRRLEWRPALLLLAVLAPLAAHADALKPFTATYALAMGKMTVGTMTRKLALGTNHGYELSSTVEATGIAAMFQDGRIVETSRGTLLDGRPRPERYDYDPGGKKKKRALAVVFDWKAGTLTTRYKGRESQATSRAGLLDKLVYQLAVMGDLASGATLTYSVADGDGITDYVLARRGDEQVVTPAGTFDTTRIERVNGSSKRRTVLWCAPKLGFLPVKIEHREKDGKITTALLQRLE
ncbi:MAG: DUF3108 domain-containing protein [Gammaproteobacteria bacterium]|nr:DUF3108 domain-containing protein [Gammaproteobacteria bacterium]